MVGSWSLGTPLFDLIVLILVLVLYGLFGVISNSIGNAKRRPGWFWAGFLLGPLGIWWIVGMPPRTKEEADAAEAERSAEIERKRVHALRALKEAGVAHVRDDLEERR